MRRAIRNHRIDFAAIIVLLVLAVLVTGYVLEHQPAFHLGQSYYQVNADFSEASAVTAGQGQAVTIAGVPIGQVGGVTVRDGVAVVQMDIEKKYAPIYRNATVLLRPRTPLKDMYLELDPGSRSAGRLPAGGHDPHLADDPRRRRLADPLLAGLRQPQLPAAAARRRRRGAEGRRRDVRLRSAEPGRGELAAGDAQALRAAGQEHADVRLAARAPPDEPAPRRPQPRPRRRLARRRRPRARLAHRRLGHELPGDLGQRQRAASRRSASSPGRSARRRPRWSSCARSPPRAARRFTRCSRSRATSLRR